MVAIHDTPISGWWWWHKPLTALQNISAGTSMVVTIVTGTLMFTGLFLGLQSTIHSSVDRIVDRISIDEQRISDIGARVSFLEKTVSDSHNEDTAFRVRMDDQIAHILSETSSIRVSIAGRGTK